MRPEVRPAVAVQETGGREEERCWKSGGGRVRLYTWRRAELVDEVWFDAMLDATGGEVVTGPLKRKGVVHRYVVNRIYFAG